MKNYILFILIIILFLVICLFLSLYTECYGYTANDNVMVTTGSSLNDMFYVDILEGFNQANIDFNDWSLYYYFSYLNGNSYVFYISSDKFNIQSNTLMYTIGQATLSFTYSNGTWTYNTFYGPSANIGTYDRSNTFYFTNDGFNMGLSNVSNYSSSNDYMLIDVSNNGGDEEDTGLLQGIKDFFIGLFIPSEELMTDIKNDFSTDILSKFNITNISRNNTSYNNSDYYEGIFRDKFPTYDIYGYRFDSEYIYIIMHTPLNFGTLRSMRDNYTEWIQPVYTSGITLFDILNLLIGIFITYTNIALYNKFFDKGD